jgi:hypothetical protein
MCGRTTFFEATPASIRRRLEFGIASLGEYAATQAKALTYYEVRAFVIWRRPLCVEIKLLTIDASSD